MRFRKVRAPDNFSLRMASGTVLIRPKRRGQDDAIDPDLRPRPPARGRSPVLGETLQPRAQLRSRISVCRRIALYDEVTAQKPTLRGSSTMRGNARGFSEDLDPLDCRPGARSKDAGAAFWRQGCAVS